MINQLSLTKKQVSINNISKSPHNINNQQEPNIYSFLKIKTYYNQDNHHLPVNPLFKIISSKSKNQNNQNKKLNASIKINNKNTSTNKDKQPLISLYNSPIQLNQTLFKNNPSYITNQNISQRQQNSMQKLRRIYSQQKLKKSIKRRLFGNQNSNHNNKTCYQNNKYYYYQNQSKSKSKKKQFSNSFGKILSQKNIFSNNSLKFNNDNQQNKQQYGYLKLNKNKKTSQNQKSLMRVQKLDLFKDKLIGSRKDKKKKDSNCYDLNSNNTKIVYNYYQDQSNKQNIQYNNHIIQQQDLVNTTDISRNSQLDMSPYL